MNLYDAIQNRVKECMKNGESFERDTLRTVLGEIQNKFEKPTDDDIVKVFRKFKLGVESTIEILKEKGGAISDSMINEISIYDKFIPSTMSVDGIMKLLKNNKAIMQAKSDGQATGIAMGLLKKEGIPIVGQDVSKAVKQLRG